MREVSPFTGSELSELYIPYCHAREAQYINASCLAHTSYLSVSSLKKRKFEQARFLLAVTVGRNESYIYGLRYHSVDLDRLSECPKLFPFRYSFDLNVVYLRYLVARMRQAVCKLAVVGEKQKSVRVQTFQTSEV